MLRRIALWTGGILGFLVLLTFVSFLLIPSKKEEGLRQGILAQMHYEVINDKSYRLAIPARIQDCPEHLKIEGGYWGHVFGFWQMPFKAGGWLTAIINESGQHTLMEPDILADEDQTRYYPILTSLFAAAQKQLPVIGIGCVRLEKINERFVWELNLKFAGTPDKAKLQVLAEDIYAIFDRAPLIQFAERNEPFG